MNKPTYLGRDGASWQETSCSYYREGDLIRKELWGQSTLKTPDEVLQDLQAMVSRIDMAEYEELRCITHLILEIEEMKARLHDKSL